ncbi:MAG TPA: AAA family ATPase, partial [bacterium]|nr:AAA family ATPase [bacterium]
PGRVAELLQLLRRRKALVLQGPPGTGKSLLARRLAALLSPPARTEHLQLHAGYAYDDFILGYRPAPGGGFSLREGLLLRLARQAQADPSHAWVLILDELNRANVGAVLGEALTLLPAELRGPEHSLALPAAAPDAPRFWLPANLHVVATMNTADRSLTPLDYALRRRFAFATLQPEFGPRFQTWLTAQGVPHDLTQRLATALVELNASLAADPSLGPDFLLGHSYFTTPPTPDPPTWLNNILNHDLAPLLHDYFPDEPATARRHLRTLRQTLDI